MSVAEAIVVTPTRNRWSLLSHRSLQSALGDDAMRLAGRDLAVFEDGSKLAQRRPSEQRPGSRQHAQAAPGQLFDSDQTA